MVANYLSLPPFLPAFLFPRAEEYMHKDWVVSAKSLHKINLYFILVKK